MTLVETTARGQYPFAHASLMLMEIKALPVDSKADCHRRERERERMLLKI